MVKSAVGIICILMEGGEDAKKHEIEQFYVKCKIGKRHSNYIIYIKVPQNK